MWYHLLFTHGKPRLRKVARAEGTSCSFSQAPQVCTHEGLGVSQPRPVSPSPSCRATNAAGSVASAAPFPDTYEHLVSKRARSRGSRWRRKNRVREQGPGDSTQATRGWKQWPHLPSQLWATGGAVEGPGLCCLVASGSNSSCTDLRPPSPSVFSTGGNKFL